MSRVNIQLGKIIGSNGEEDIYCEWKPEYLEDERTVMVEERLIIGDVAA